MIAKDGTNQGSSLADAKTGYIIPVDLNALMYKNYRHMMDFSAGAYYSDEMFNKYNEKAQKMLAAMKAVFWDEKEKMWFDYDLLNNKRRQYYYASNLVPLWAEAYDMPKQQIAQHSMDYLEREGVLNHEGGLPTSKMKSGQQWDFNCWPPLQHMIVSGLNKTEDERAKQVAFGIAKTYVDSIVAGCDSADGKCEFYEKYDPTTAGKAGGGGEYVVQLGFGWTNGVLIDFISIYGDRLCQKEK